MNTQTHEKDSSPNLAQQQQQQQDTQQSAAQAQQGQAQDEAQAVQAQQATQKAQSAQKAAVGAELAGAKGGGAAQTKAAKSGKAKAKANAQTKKQAAAQAKTSALNPGASVQTTPAQEEQTVNNYSKSRDEQHADEATAPKMASSKAAQSAKNDKLQDAKGKKKEASATSKKDEKGKKKEAATAQKDDDKGKKKEAAIAQKDDDKGKKKEAAADAKKGDAQSAKAAPEAKNDLQKKAVNAQAAKTKAPAASLSDGKKADAKQSKKGNEKKTAKATSKSSNASSGGAAGGGSSISASAGGGGAGGGGADAGGGVALPVLGANAPAAPAPKGEGTGKNAIETYATSGLSHQLEHHAELGPKVQEDLQNSETQKIERLPGEKGAEINDGARDAENQAAVEASKSTNAGNQTAECDGSMKTKLEAAASEARARIKAQKVSGKGEDIPNAPAVEADMSAVDAAQAENSEKFASAKSEAAQKVSSLDKKLPSRGYDDIRLPQIELEEEQTVLESAALEKAAELEQFHEEAKGLLDHTDDADAISSQMQEAATQVDSADKESDVQLDASIAEHEAEIEQIRANAQASEEEQIAAIEADMNSEIDAQSAEFETQAANYDAENQQSIASARSQIEQEKTSVQADISREKQKAEKDKQEAEEKDQKEEKAWYEKLADKAKNAAKRFVSRLKSAISGIIDNFLQTVNNLLDKFADLVSKVNKDLGDKLRKVFDKFKQLLDKFAKALVDIVNKFLDLALNIFTIVVDQITADINDAIDKFKSTVKKILESVKEAFKVAFDIIKSVLQFNLLNFAENILRLACVLCGADPEPILAAAKQILTHPFPFVKTLIKGVLEGFSNFGKNLPENIKAMFQNLCVIWFGGAGLEGIDQLPHLMGFLKLGLSIIGIKPGRIVKNLDKAYKKREEEKEKAEKEKAAAEANSEEKTAKESQEKPKEDAFKSFINGVRTGGLTYLAELIMPHLLDFGTELIKAIASSLIPTLISKVVARLASMATPIGGIVAAIKGVWDMIQFFKSQLSGLAALGSALVNVLVKAANGDTSAAATAVEAALCQAIPLTIELVLRVFLGINISAKINKFVKSFSKKIQKFLDSAILSKLSKFKVPTFESVEKKKEKEKEDKENLSELREKQAIEEGNKYAAAGYLGAKQSEKVSKWKSDQRVKFKDTAETIKGEKVGTLGIDVNNLKSVKAADEYHEVSRLLANPDQARAEILKKQQAAAADQSKAEENELTGAEKQFMHITALQSAQEKMITGEPLTPEEKTAVTREAKNKEKGIPTLIPTPRKPAGDSLIQNVLNFAADIRQGAAGGKQAARIGVRKDILEKKKQIGQMVVDAKYLREGHSLPEYVNKKRLDKEKEAENE